MKRLPLVLSVMIIALLLISGCAPGPNTGAPLDGSTPAGFWLGLWHGFIVIITFIVSLFTDNVGIYELSNNGNWYNFGFVLGLTVALGGSGKGSGLLRNNSDSN